MAKKSKAKKRREKGENKTSARKSNPVNIKRARAAKAKGERPVKKMAKRVKRAGHSARAAVKKVRTAAGRTPVKSARKSAKTSSRGTSAPRHARKLTAVAAPRKVSKDFRFAVQAYEKGIKFMHADEFEKAKVCFERLIRDFPNEREIHERAHVLIQACEQRIKEKRRLVVRTAEEHYDVGIAELNGRQLDSALHHLEQALKLSPKSDHILYALAAANALVGNRDRALQCLKQSIHYRNENRFLAANDSDFETLAEDPEFRHLVLLGN